MNKIARNFAAATLSLSSLLATTGFAAEPTQLAATKEEMTVPDSRGYIVVSKNALLFSACTADNYRATSHFFLAATPSSQPKLNEEAITRIEEIEYAKNMKAVATESFEAQYANGVRSIAAEDFVEAIARSALPLKLRQFMNMMDRSLNKNAKSVDISWRLKGTTVSNTPDPSCVTKTLAVAP